MKSNTVTRFKIISGLRNSLQNHKWVPAPQQAVWRGLLEGFLQLEGVFIEASQNFIFYFLHNKAAKKIQNYRRYAVSNDLIFKTFKKLFILWHNPYK